MSAAEEIATLFDTTMAEAIEVAEGATDADWQTVCPAEERTVGILFDHIADGNRQVVEWIELFLGDKPVAITREQLNADNARHAHHAADRPKQETTADLRESAIVTAKVLRGLGDEQLQMKQEFAWSGTQDVAFLAAAAARHAQRHMTSILEALGR